MGHIDHGKSSLLEAVRDFGITRGESGGITQHIGAYEVEEDGKEITFIDTPGHRAFSAMRSRGAEVADIAILVVAADEGVKDQTEEAIDFIEQAEVPMVVAINKMDKEEADPNRVRRQLADCGVELEAGGGKTPSVEVSAKTGENIDELLEVISLVAEMENLETDLSERAQGVIIESYLDSQQGPLATVLLRRGVLKIGDLVGTDSTFGTVKNMEDSQGERLEEIKPSQPALVLGFSEVPRVGEQVFRFEEKEQAQKFVEREETAPTTEQLGEGLKLVLKADVQGSIEAIEQVLEEIPQEKLKLRMIMKEVGDINEADVRRADTVGAEVIGFRVEPSSQAEQVADRTGVEIKTYDVIYDLVEGVRDLMKEELGTELTKEEVGRVKTLVDFKTEGKRQIVGGKITKGEVNSGDKLEIIRDKEKVGQGKIVNLQQNKKDVDHLTRGEECGILFEGNARIEESDLLRIYREQQQQKSLEQ